MTQYEATVALDVTSINVLLRFYFRRPTYYQQRDEFSAGGERIARVNAEVAPKVFVSLNDDRDPKADVFHMLVITAE